MKKFITTFLSISLFNLTYSQLKSPVASPRTQISQKLGLLEINLDYSRPSKKGRVIFGNLVPYNQIWRTGANQPSTISFSDNVKINNQFIEKGEYHIYSVPRESSLDLVLYDKTKNWGALTKFDEAQIKARVTSEFFNLPFSIETFTISIGDISNNGGTLNIIWDNKAATYIIDVLTKEKMIKNIKDIMSGNPTLNDYRKAAIYYYEEKIYIDKALEWIDIAFKDSDNLKYWQLRYKALIYERAGKLKKALKYAEKGYDLALKNNIPDGINTLQIIYKRLKD